MPPVQSFKPVGVRRCEIDEIVMTLEEWEALRLNDRDGIEQQDAAVMMGVSKPTFHRIITEARRKTVAALTRGKALRIEGGDFRLVERLPHFACRDCGHEWQASHGTDRRGMDMTCPGCGGGMFTGTRPAAAGWDAGPGGGRKRPPAGE